MERSDGDVGAEKEWKNNIGDAENGGAVAVIAGTFCFGDKGSDKEVGNKAIGGAADAIKNAEKNDVVDDVFAHCDNKKCEGKLDENAEAVKPDFAATLDEIT